MQLQPRHPPRRKRRKVRAFADEIHRLQADGYTCQEICEALADAGVVVSRSTVQREAARRSLPIPRVTGGVPASVGVHVAPSPPIRRTSESSDSSPGPTEPRSSRQLAEAFFEAHPANPLLQRKENA